LRINPVPKNYWGRILEQAYVTKKWAAREIKLDTISINAICIGTVEDEECLPQ